MVEGLKALGRDVRVRELAPDGFPGPSAAGSAALEEGLGAEPTGRIVLLDGLAGGAYPEVIERHASRLRLMALVHHPLAREWGLGSNERRRLDRLERRTLSHVGGVVVTSASTARDVESMGVDRAHIRIVQPGIDKDLDAGGGAGPALPPGDGRLVQGLGPEALNRSSTIIRFLCVGSLVPRKGQLDLIEALSALEESGPDWELILVGSADRDPTYARHVRERLAEAGLSSRVRMTGEVDDAELGAHYRESAVFVLASRHEGYGMVLAEALQHGLPIVSTAAGAIPEVVPATAGLLVSPGQPKALTEALRQILGEPDLRESLARGARQAGLTLPSWTRQAHRMDLALQDLTNIKTEQKHVFGFEWLHLREPVDHRSRPDELLPPLARWIQTSGSGTAVDLGGGSGSNVRYLAPRLTRLGAPLAQWLVIDHDLDLLARVPPEVAGGEVVPFQGDLRSEGLSQINSSDLVTASALLDLATHQWLQSLVHRARDSKAALLLALSWDGTIEWDAPSDPLDAEVCQLVRAHQRGDKGMGPALGPDAPLNAVTLLEAAGFRVTTAPSAWLLGPDEHLLAGALLDGWTGAASELQPDRASDFHDWARRRSTQIAKGAARLTVGHMDVLALPGEAGSPP